MAKTLTATRNPVGVWGETGTGTTTIAWNTGSAARGRVYISVATGTTVPLSETLFDGDPTNGARSGSKALPVQFGSIYTLVLRQITNNAALVTLVVTVVDVSEQVTAQAAASAALMQQFNPTQAIYDLRIHAGIDTVRISFKTVQPTIPVIRVLAPDGTEVASSFALYAGMQTQHQALLGSASPLDQGTQFDVTILASGHNYLGKPHDTVATSQFTTGTRIAMIEFDEINVRKDGDPGIKGDGEFTFIFGAGDVAGRSNLGEPWPIFEADINDDDPPVFINKKIDIPMAPRNLWVQVVGSEDDRSILYAPGIGLSQKPSFDNEGSGSASIPETDQAWVTGYFNISDAVHGTTIPMTLATGDFGVAFTVSGSIFVQTTPGISPVIFAVSNIARNASSLAVLAKAGALGGMFPKQSGGQSGDGQAGGGQTGDRGSTLLGRGPNGAVYRRLPDPNRRKRRDEGWALAAPAVEGLVTAVAMGQDRLALFTLDAEGAVLHANLAGDRAAEWRKLGGHFNGALAVASLADSVALFARDDAGAVFHLTLPAKGGAPTSDWRRIGDGVQGGLTAVSLGRDTFAVFALGRRGEVLHQFQHDGRWRTEGWQAIAGATGGLLGVGSAEGKGLALAVVGEDLKLHTLIWRDYPEKRPEPWVSHGDLQSWLVRPLAPTRRAQA